MGTISRASLQAQTYTGKSWIVWSQEKKVAFIDGMMLGVDVTQGRLAMSGLYMPEAIFYQLYLLDDVSTLVEEVDSFYEQTGRYDYPIFAALYMRNVWKAGGELPPWDESKMGEKNKETLL